MYNKWLKILCDKKLRFNVLCSKNLLFWKTDEEVVKQMYFYSFNKRLDLDKPKTYQEKLQWLKLYDKQDIYMKMVDKFEAKAFIAHKIGAEYVIPTLGVWEKFDSINFNLLPNQFVLKCTHDSGGVIICKNKEQFDFNSARKKINKCLKRNYYYLGREWPYKGLKPRIIAEPYLEDNDDKELRDYKFFTFSGEPKIMYIAQGRSKEGETSADFFDMNFNHLELQMDHKMAQKCPHKPTEFEKMKEIAGVLSKGIPQLRVDFYEVNGKLYVGELTFFHCSGLAPVTPTYWEKQLSEWITIPMGQGE